MTSADRGGGEHLDHAVRRQLLLLVGAADLDNRRRRKEARAGENGFNGRRCRAQIVAAADLCRHRDDLRQIIARDLGLAGDEFDLARRSPSGKTCPSGARIGRSRKLVPVDAVLRRIEPQPHPDRLARLRDSS